MNSTALALVLVAAFVHATWNLLVKRAGGGVPFLWLFALVTTIAYAPLAIGFILIRQPRFGGTELLFLSGATVLHLIYFVLLQRGYRVGDLSFIYPMARGTGPLLAIVAAIAIMGERPTPVALGGAALIATGVFILTGGLRKLGLPGSRAAVVYGLITGASITAYTLWDKTAVGTILISPLLLEYCSNLGRVALLTPGMLRRWQEVREQWRCHRKEALAVGFLCPFSYILVLTAMVFTPVSYVAPAREISILIGALMGTRFLGEGDKVRRLIAASAMVAGVGALAVG